MKEVERVVIQETGDEGYFKDVVARQDIAETKRIVEDVSNMKELTTEEIKIMYNDMYKEIFG